MVAFNQVFKEMFGLENAWGSCVPDGKTDPAIVAELAQASLGRALTDLEYSNLCNRYLQLFDENIPHASRFRLLPGVTELLEHLAGRPEFALGVATGNFEQVAWSKLERGRIRHHFRFGGFGSDSLHRPELTQRAMSRGHQLIGRQLPSEDIVVIGDTIWDIKAGKHIGAVTVGVTTGSYTVEDFRKAGADLVLPDLSDFKQFLKILEKK